MNDTVAGSAQDEAPDIFELFEVDPEAEKGGVKLPIGRSWFRIRSADCAAYRAARTRQIIGQGKITEANRGVLPLSVVDENLVELACVVVTDWGDVPHPDEEKRKAGVAFPYSPANAKALFSDRRMHKLREWVLNQAQSHENYSAAAAAAIAGNSPSASAGISSEGQSPAA